MLKKILTLEGVEKLNKHQQSLLIGGTVDTEDDGSSWDSGGGGGTYKKCKLCMKQSDCGEGTCVSGIPYCSDGQKRCL